MVRRTKPSVKSVGIIHGDEVGQNEVGFKRASI